MLYHQGRVTVSLPLLRREVTESPDLVEAPGPFASADKYQVRGKYGIIEDFLLVVHLEDGDVTLHGGNINRTPTVTFPVRGGRYIPVEEFYEPLKS